MVKGILYKNAGAYNLITRIKLGTDAKKRYKIAARYIKEGESVLDVCAGTGELRKYLPNGCQYSCVEASPEFNAALSRAKIQYYTADLHNGNWPKNVRVDRVVMLISLYQFRNTSVHQLLEEFKKCGRKVIIVEDVLEQERKQGSWVDRTINHLCDTDYFRPVNLYTFDEFKTAMEQHQYTCERIDKRYCVGTYENK